MRINRFTALLVDDRAVKLTATGPVIDLRMPKPKREDTVVPPTGEGDNRTSEQPQPQPQRYESKVVALYAPAVVKEGDIILCFKGTVRVTIPQDVKWPITVKDASGNGVQVEFAGLKVEGNKSYTISGWQQATFLQYNDAWYVIGR